MTIEASNFRSFLRNELIRRCKTNQRYSLRAFAKSIGIHHATLSSIISGKRAISEKTIIKIGSALRLPEQNLKKFISFNRSEKGRSPQRHHDILALDVFNMIAEWYHYAILELTHIKGFKPEIPWIAKKLGISNIQAQSAVERLERLKLLNTKKSPWLDMSRNSTTDISNNISSAALRSLQKKVLELSTQALEEYPRSERDHTSLTIAMEASDLDEVKNRIKRFTFELVEFLESKKNPDSVYQMAFSIFPLTKRDTTL